MKKVLFIILVLFSFIGAINASDYSCEIVGDDIIYSNSNKTSYINVNITNVEDLLSFRMYIKYNNKKFDVDTCQFLNYTTSSCSLRTNDNSLIFYDYLYNKDYSLKDYPFFYANFKSNENTPNTGTTTISVYFEDVKDKNNKSITIDKCEKKLSFEEGNGEIDVKTDTFNISIDGYNFEFDENTYEYNLDVKSEVNSLDIKVESPDSYKYIVNGATDLNSFGNKVTIDVTTPDNNNVTYTINVIREKTEIETTNIKENIKDNLKNIKKYLPYILGVIVILLIIIIIIKKKDNNKMDKYLKDL